MSAIKLGQEGKQIFIDCYNDSSIPWNQLNKVITQKLQEKGILQLDQKFTADFVRSVYEEKLGLMYKNRPKGPKTKLEVLFDEEETTTVEEDSVLLEPAVQTETTVNTEEEETVNQWQTRQEPSKFEF